jgi:RNA polymerase sigma-70 factor (ECF subfamily)
MVSKGAAGPPEREKEDAGGARPTTSGKAGRPGTGTRERGEARPQPLPPIDPLRREHEAYVRRLVSRHGAGAAGEHDDLVQEVLVEAHRSRCSPLEPAALLSGIFRHVRAHLSRRRAGAIKLAEAIDSRPHTAGEAYAASPEELAITASRIQIVRRALLELPPIFRDILLACDLGGLALPEAARELCIPLNTGHTRLRLGRGRLRAALARLMAQRRLRAEDV